MLSEFNGYENLFIFNCTLKLLYSVLVFWLVPISDGRVATCTKQVGFRADVTPHLLVFFIYNSN